jgi:hypothetical protein
MILYFYLILEKVLGGPYYLLSKLDFAVEGRHHSNDDFVVQEISSIKKLVIYCVSWGYTPKHQ